MRDHETVKSVAVGLEKIRTHMGDGEAVPDQDVVTQVHSICAHLVAEITGEKG